MNLPIRAVLALGVIWIIASGVIYFARSTKPTSASVETAFASAELAGKTDDQRSRVIEKIAAQLNRLPYDERRELRRSGVSEDFFRSLTPEEQLRFLDATLPTGFKQMMEAFNKMDREKRKELVDRALREMQRQDSEESTAPPAALDDQNVQRIVDQGLRSFYNDSNAEVKADLAPLIEQLQHSLQRGR